ncbi:hypothetical protein C1H88_03400 [Streptococcus agalactiae]|uniref:hypothetical protein n=1 Tax=Streptococcus agalactiae TaxID=1311 RepID=UPI0010112ECA|nr:hypothetical protein [Streptococcus agalactiae]RXN51677.1 hypothetical protein C1H88_03400 [Streptococcus agalactiae]
MAKIGLNFGEKIQIADKEYRTFNDGLDVSVLLGDLSWRRYEEPVQFTEDDTTQPPDRNGRYPQKPTGEVKWNDVAVYSTAQEETIFISITDMPSYAIEDLGLKLGDPIELNDVVVTWSNVSGGMFKLFASSIKKKGVANNGNAPKQEAQKDNK